MATNDQPTKSIALHFEVPADMDTPSEVLAGMKGLVIEALERMKHNSPLTEHERQLVDALLLES